MLTVFRGICSSEDKNAWHNSSGLCWLQEVSGRLVNHPRAGGILCSRIFLCLFNMAVGHHLQRHGPGHAML
jgi:hypothetical protein